MRTAYRTKAAAELALKLAGQQNAFRPVHANTVAVLTPIERYHLNNGRPWIFR